jgi:hypothetical protein
MAKGQKPNNSECYTPSLEPFSFYGSTVQWKTYKRLCDWSTRTLASFSRHGSRLEWCSQGPTNTMGGSVKSSACISLCTAPVHPWPAKITASCSDAWTAFRKMSRASCLQQYNKHHRQEHAHYLLCSLVEVSGHFGGTYSLHFRGQNSMASNQKGQRAACHLKDTAPWPLTMWKCNVSKFYQTTWCHVPEDGTSHCHMNLRYRQITFYITWGKKYYES